jgi:hypothetical protein
MEISDFLRVAHYLRSTVSFASLKHLHLRLKNGYVCNNTTSKAIYLDDEPANYSWHRNLPNLQNKATLKYVIKITIKIYPNTTSTQHENPNSSPSS